MWNFKFPRTAHQELEVGFVSTDLHPVCIAFSKLCNMQVMKHQPDVVSIRLDENFMHQFSQSRSPLLRELGIFEIRRAGVC